MTRARRHRRFEQGDVVAVALLLGIPLAALSIAAIAGYPLLTGDDLVQSYPLSVLSAQIIAHGHLPIYNPYLWSGSPLLAGANAHALLPSTLLFTFLPNLVAWVLEEALTLGAAAVGCYVLLRRNGCRALAAGLGGATFGLGGFVSSQIVHIDFVSAAAALVWCLVAIDGIVRDGPWRRAPWAFVLAIATACVGLSASPDIVIDAVVVVIVFGGHLLITARGRRLICTGWAAAGAAAGWLLSGVQWLPTAEFVAVSERAHASYAFASSGSLSAAELLVSIVPHVLGGGPIGLKTYTGPYNLAELDAYCGILSLVAVLSLAARWRTEHAPRWRVWYLVGGLGLLLALGAHTPLEHLLIHLPVVGSQRLPSRALVLFSLASAMLLGYWVEEQLSAEPGDASVAVIAAGTAAPVVVLGLIIVTVLTGEPYGGLLDALRGSGWTLRAVLPYLAVTAVLALGAAAIVIGGPRWGRRRLSGVILALVVADLLVFTANQSSLAPVYARALDANNPLQAQLAARLRGGGRFLVVDPSRSSGIALDELGASNFGVVSGLSSAQGYGSLTWGPYASATGTHSQDDVDPTALSTKVFDTLDVRVLLTVPNELSVPLRRTAPIGSGPAQLPGIGAPPIAGVSAVPSPVNLGAGTQASRWFGRALVVRSVTLELAGAPRPPAALAALARQVRLVPSAGAELSGSAGVPAAGARDLEVSFRTSRTFVGLSMTNPTGAPIKVAAVVVTARTGTYGLDGALAADLTAPHWQSAGTIGPFVVFANRRASGQFSLGARTSPAGSGTVARPAWSVRVVQSSRWTPAETVAIDSAAPATIVRSVADLPGWRATEAHDGLSRAIPLHRDGLVQSFEVPSGSTLVTFTYDPPGLRAGLVASGLGLLGLVALGVVSLVFSRRRRAQPTRAPCPAGTVSSGEGGPGGVPSPKGRPPSAARP